MKYLLLFSIPALLLGQTVIPNVIPNGAPPSHVFDGRIDEWKALPPTFVLRSTTGGRKANVWVRQTPEGLLIAGEVSGPLPDFPRDETELPNKDHVEIWLAPENPPAFPPVGWENVLGPVPVRTRQDCITYVKKEMPGFEPSCDEWLAEVAAHRPLVSRLFVRQFALSPQVVTETYAQPAWQQIVQDRSDLEREWSPLKPKELPSFAAEPFDGGYGFESLVPWEALPPLTALDLKSLRLMVDVFSARPAASKTQPFSTSSPLRKYGQPSTMNLVKLAVGRNFQVTSCEYPLEELEPHRGLTQASFRPGSADKVMQVLLLVNQYSHRGFTAVGESPALEVIDHWQGPLAGLQNATACGPELALRDRAGIRPLQIPGDQDALSALVQWNGGYLVKSGPTVSEEDMRDKLDPCFECRIVDLYILEVSPSGEPRKLLELHQPAGAESQLLDVDIQMSPDWNKVTIYRETSHDPSEWESETLCRQASEYKSCEKKSPSGPPPLPRVVRPYEAR